MTPLTSSEKQSRRTAELDAIAQAAGWATWTKYATAVKRGVVSIAANPQGECKMDKYVYGWYHYADGTDKEFRYPSEREDELKQDGKSVTVEVKDVGKWNTRRGAVNWGGGNYTVTPR